MGAPHATRASHSFAPSVRLCKPAQFASALKGRRIGRSDWLMLSAARATATITTATVAAADNEPAATAEATGNAQITQQQQARLGLIIAKRYARLAVTRNTIKRTLRETFRQQRQTLPARDYVFRLHCRIERQPLAQLKQHVRSQAQFLLQQARLRAS